MDRTLSKSDFKLAGNCLTKLYYKELGYPRIDDSNEYLQLLAEGGYMVEQLARLRYPDGVELPHAGDAGSNAAATAEMLSRDNVTLFEATLLSGRKLARVDILQKRGRRFDLIEVKSTSFDGDDARTRGQGPFRAKTKQATLLTDWIPYLEDVTYQYLVLHELYPDAEIVPHLLLVDKSQTTSVEELPGMFDIRRDIEIDGRRTDLDVRYLGDPATPAAQELLRCVNVVSEVEELLPAVAAAAAEMVSLYGDQGMIRVQQPIDWSCKQCEFKVGIDQRPNGFRECWGRLADPAPHIFELYSFGNIKRNGERVSDVLIRNGKTSLYDVDPALLVKKNGEPTAFAARQLVQIEHTRSGTPWISDSLRPAMDGWQYPLHFIDFETSTMALPYHAGMRPFEIVGFQWSCHTVHSIDAPPVHTEWLNDRDGWPCLEFVESLRRGVGDEGTVLMWSHHEGTTLKAIRAQLDRYGVGAPDLRAWMDRLVGSDGGPRRLQDMNDLCHTSFFHPGMAGRTSIKVVLDTLWRADPVIREHFELWMGDQHFRVAGTDGPYESLPPVIIGDVQLQVSEGTGAMKAYHAIRYGEERRHPEQVAGYRDLLLRYCKLDTLAMVLIWDHWRRVAT